MIKVEIARHPAGDLVGIVLRGQLRVLTIEEAQQLTDRLNELLPKSFPKEIHSTILAIDEKLGQVDNLDYRLLLVKATYRLRLLEQWMQKNKEAK